jgi:glutathione S-transferase
MLTLYLHPLASFCHKVLIALYENATPFTPVTVDFADPGAAAAHLDRWPVGKIPVLHDAGRDQTVPETSIIIEHLQRHHPGPVPLIPADPAQALDVRLWDRFFDLYVSQPMQKIVLDRLRPDGQKDPFGVAEARQTLDTAYAMVDARLAAGPWATGAAFTLADCAAAPGLFFAGIVHPFGLRQHDLCRYVDRLLTRPSVRRTLAEAQPFFPLFPYHDAMPPELREFPA